MQSRRQLLSAVGFSIVGSGAVSTAVSASPRGWEGVRTDPPSGNVEVQVVSYGNREREEDIKSGVWLNHRFGYQVGRQNRNDAEELFEKIDFVVELDGERLENPKQYFEDFSEFEKRPGGFVGWFNAYTPPRSPGEYTFSIKAIRPRGTIGVEGTYEITPGR